MKGDIISIETPKKPDLDFSKIWDLLDDPGYQEAVLKTQSPEYLHWTSLKYKSWIPKQLSPLEFWGLIKLSRSGGSKIAIRDINGKHFTWQKLAHYDRLLHDLDLNTGGTLLGQHAISDEEKKSFISRGIIEEAIASAQLEGAHTTREVAKKLIQEGRAPQNHGQKMIVNNYQTMLRIEQDFKGRALSLEMLFDLHAILTEGTLEKPDQVGRFRLESEEIVVASDEGQIAYIPPPVDFVKQEIERLIAFANDQLDEGSNNFLHPVIKAISLHFWIGFLHPFADGNGRLARALFYWYLLKQGYWTFAFIPVSTVIKRSPKQYARAYILSEQDDNDLTYFIDYNLRKIQLARRDFKKYLDKKVEQSEELKEINDRFPDLNHRQISLASYFKACPHERTNVTAMTKIYGVGEMTAINDLKTMVSIGLLNKKRQGRNVFYYPTSKLLLDSAADK